jgi:hypothetical protein
MKNIKFLVIVLLTATAVCGQEHLTLQENGLFQWQKVYEANNTNDLKSDLLTSVVLNNIIVLDDDSFKGEFLAAPNWRQAMIDVGKKPMSTPIGIRSYDLKGTALVEIKGGRYRVTVQELKFVYKEVGNSYEKKGNETPFEDFVLKANGAIRPWYTKEPNWLELYDETLSNLFILKESGDDW